ncbi:carbohydrate ABC transporter permease [Paenibacillus soyae]|uniref:Sugar ABC transporter permease n=1 Tax=Paenibacillus soyae TaxID=2969249 RepID=A0A9X2MY62_9BACL|nr:sugar ABC transporter permease [Paenibacillus soyae]MCR2808068.1 sugar ABC transporter permease [Paenibacillus soyae]
MESKAPIVKVNNKEPRSKFSKILYSQTIAPYVFVLPFIITFAVFFVYPVFSAFSMSFQEIVPGESKFVGLDNYQEIWNPMFKKAVMNSAIYTVLTLALLIPIPLVLAVLLNSKVMILKDMFRATLFIPALTSVVVAGTIFRMAFGELEGSLMNSIVTSLGFEKQKWLGDQWLGMMTLLILACWRWIGVNLLYFLAGLQNIPKELYESASIDGATTWKQFTNITMPMLKPITIYVFTISIYGGLAMFTESFVLWSGNRSPKDIGLTIVGYLYRTGWEQFNLGLGAAVGVALLGITLIVTIIQLTFFGMFRKES